MSTQRNRGRPPKKANSSPELSSTDDDTASTLSEQTSTATITSLEETNFINETTSKEVIHTLQADMVVISKIANNKDATVEKNAVLELASTANFLKFVCFSLANDMRFLLDLVSLG